MQAPTRTHKWIQVILIQYTSNWNTINHVHRGSVNRLRMKLRFHTRDMQTVNKLEKHKHTLVLWNTNGNANVASGSIHVLIGANVNTNTIELTENFDHHNLEAKKRAPPPPSPPSHSHTAYRVNGILASNMGLKIYIN